MPGLGDYEKKEEGERGFEMPMKEYGKGKNPITMKSPLEKSSPYKGKTRRMKLARKYELEDREKIKEEQERRSTMAPKHPSGI